MEQTDQCANLDFLTKLYNRSYCLDFIEMLIRDNREFSIFYLDLNKFSIVNDVYGHGVGDLVLKEVTKRFKSLEKADLLFARFGGDEFIGIYQNIDEDKINELGKNIHKVLEEHIVISESEFTISVSIGVARYPLDSDNIDDLLKLSDIVMYKAKESGSTHEYLISDEVTKKLSTRKKMEKLLRDLDIEKDLFIEYQPIYNIKTGRLTSLEAVVRWDHPTEGIIYPNDFIQVAEEIDLIKDITKWVFITALKQIRVWNEKYNKDYKISLNVADACIHNKIFFDNVKYMLETFKVRAEWVTIELSELSLSVSPEYMKQLLSSVDAMGIDIQLDNFGTHPIILSDLKDFKIRGIKIDQQLIAELDSETDYCLVGAMIRLAEALGIKTIAKGVEKKEQYELLQKLHCDKVQGFYFEKPLSKEAIEEKYMMNKNK